jgi:hypothetical protein
MMGAKSDSGSSARLADVAALSGQGSQAGSFYNNHEKYL